MTGLGPVERQEHPGPRKDEKAKTVHQERPFPAVFVFLLLPLITNVVPACTDGASTQESRPPNFIVVFTDVPWAGRLYELRWLQEQGGLSSKLGCNPESARTNGAPGA